MLLSRLMISGFNTDVNHEGCVYHVQTEDRGKENPFLESLVYIGGTIVAKKSTPYLEHLEQGASEATIASLLKRQHQVIIAAIKAGRIEDLIHHSSKQYRPAEPQPPSPPNAASPPQPKLDGKEAEMPKSTRMLASPPRTVSAQAKKPVPARADAPGNVRKGKSEPLNLDDVIAEYMKRSSEQGRLDLNVVSPNVFTAGKSINLKVKILYGTKPEAEASVTVKIVGTAFKPQVYMGHAGHDGVASFNLNLPSFTAGTAAIVIEAQSLHGRGELKHLIRRA
ncbi:MAG TPA: hypothetical protein VF131_07535 [Blastocatellia bacterium]|nr:hypothetical protein [Blastocatellia bacterium]